MKTGKKWIRLLGLAAACSCLSAIGMQVLAFDWFNPDNNEPGATPEDSTQTYRTVAETGQLSLQMTDTTGRIRIEDKQTGHQWRCFSKNELSEEVVNDFTYLQSNVESALLCTYFSKEVADASYQSVYADECSAVTVKEVDNGADAVYQFDSIGIEIAVEYRLMNNTLEVRIPKDRLRESGDYLIATVSVAPFLGSGLDTEEGFVLIPNGCGSLIRFKDEHPVYNSFYEQSVFGSDMVRVEDNIYSSQEDVMLPVYGISKGDYAMTCDIREGREDTSIVCWPSGYRFMMTGAYPTFHMRRPYYATLANTSTVRKYSTDPVQHDFSVVYTFLEQGKNTYSDMAASYRAYLLESGGLQPQLKTDGVLALDVFMAAQETRMLSNDYLPVTTFDQAQEMLEELTGSGADRLLVQMTGWIQGGYTANPNRFPIPRAIGGRSGSQAFNAYAKQAGIPVYYADDYLSADKTKGSVNMNTVVYQGNRLIAETDATAEKYLFSPSIVKKLFGNEQKNYEKNGVTGLTLERMGRELYFDYNSKFPAMSRQDTARVWQEVMAMWTAAGKRLAVQGGNGYVLPYAELLRDIPTRDSGYFFRDETVPFYQLVVHGSVLYTGTPINLYSDSRSDYLRMIEYGSLPVFIVSHDNPKKLITSDYNRLFSSEFSQYKERILEQYRVFSTQLAGLNGQAMVSHRQVAGRVYCTSYGDGTQVYVNYGKEPYTDGTITVGGEDFFVKRR